MKWWERLRQLQKHRWLPFFLPVIGTLLYIAIAMLLVPSEFGEKGDRSDAEGAESEKPAPDKSATDTNRTKATGRIGRKRVLPPTPGVATASAAAPTNP